MGSRLRSEYSDCPHPCMSRLPVPRVITTEDVIKFIKRVFVSLFTQQLGRYDDDFAPDDSSLQALEGGEGGFMPGFFNTVSSCMYVVLVDMDTLTACVCS